MDFIDPLIEAYALEHTEKESDLLFNLNRQTHLKVLQPRMLSGHLQGRILSFLSSAIKPKNILEIGTYTGYSALCMAEGLSKNGKLVTIDKNIELETMVKKYINDSSYKNQISLLSLIDNHALLFDRKKQIVLLITFLEDTLAYAFYLCHL